MVADSDKTLIDRLREAMLRRKINARQLSAIIDIPSDRIYKWLNKGYSPKAHDVEILQRWMGAEETSNVPQETGATEHKKDPPKSLEDLTESHKSLSRSNEIQAENMSRLITLLEFSLGKSVQGLTEPGPQIPLSAESLPAPVTEKSLRDKRAAQQKDKQGQKGR